MNNPIKVSILRITKWLAAIHSGLSYLINDYYNGTFQGINATFMYIEEQEARKEYAEEICRLYNLNNENYQKYKGKNHFRKIMQEKGLGNLIS